MDSGKFEEGVLRADSVGMKDNRMNHDQGGEEFGRSELNKEQRFLSALYELSNSLHRPVKPEEAEVLLAEFEV